MRLQTELKGLNSSYIRTIIFNFYDYSKKNEQKNQRTIESNYDILVHIRTFLVYLYIYV